MDDLSNSIFHTDSRMMHDLHQGGGDMVWGGSWRNIPPDPSVLL